MGAGDDLMSMWSGFTASGQIPGMSDGPHVTGMVSGQVTLEPGETKEVTIVLGWYFPDRDFLGIPVGMLLRLPIPKIRYPKGSISLRRVIGTLCNTFKNP